MRNLRRHIPHPFCGRVKPIVITIVLAQDRHGVGNHIAGTDFDVELEQLTLIEQPVIANP